MLVSVIIPVLHDAPALASLLAQLSAAPGVDVVVAAGCRDPALEQTVALRAGTRLVCTTAGRGHQMNAGAEAAAGDWLLFLHSDSVLPPAWATAIERSVASVHAVGGWFRFGLDAPDWQARVIERLVALRTRFWKLPYGDQGIFVRRDIFDTLGGYREVPLMEDVDFMRRLVRAGPVVEVPLPLLTSARRWHRDGWFRRSALNLALVGLYLAGVSPERLGRWYDEKAEGKRQKAKG